MYRWVDHTSELELQIEAATETEVFEEATAALSELLADDDGRAPAPAERDVRDVAAAGGDRATLLADWLGELVFLAETEGFMPTGLARLDREGDDLRARVEGHRGRPRHLVKAVTYHGLSFDRDGGAWRASVVLDV